MARLLRRNFAEPATSPGLTLVKLRLLLVTKLGARLGFYFAVSRRRRSRYPSRGGRLLAFLRRASVATCKIPLRSRIERDASDAAGLENRIAGKRRSLLRRDTNPATLLLRGQAAQQLASNASWRICYPNWNGSNSQS